MPNFASIDTGSNTLRLLIANIGEGKNIKDIYYERRVTRLGSGIDKRKIIDKDNFELSINAFKDFSNVISKFNVIKTIAFGTSALREALNAEEFIKEVYEETGIMIRVISGEKEAELTLKGIILSFPTHVIEEQSVLIADIGGGSTEFIFLKNKEPIFMDSLPLGVIKLVNRFLKSDPIKKEELEALINEIDKYIFDLKGKTKAIFGDEFLFVGTAGTFSTIASVDLMLEEYKRDKIHLHTIPYGRLEEINDGLISLTIDERKKLKGLEPERADLIVPGMVLTLRIMKLFDIKELMISDYGILEGALLELYEEFSMGNA